MEEKNIAELSDSELREKARKMKRKFIGRAFTVGFMIGVLVYSAAMNSWGLVTIIPLFFIYILTRKDANEMELKAEISRRNLKEGQVGMDRKKSSI